jgi:TctA family transporter
MGQYAPEVVWACAFGVSAVLQLSIVLYQQCAAMWARVFAIWNAALWLAAVVLMIAGVYPPPAAIGGEIALTVSALWIAVRPLYFLRWERLHAVQR